MAVAKTQKKMAEIGGSYTGAQNNMSAFSKMEAKANKMLDEANAMAELNQSSAEADINDLASKYDTEADLAGSAVDDELAALKAQMGK